MKLILAQGNPGDEYTNTRHNVGFMALDYACNRLNSSPFQQKIKFQSLISESSHRGEKIILAKPTTFYNQTGQAARALADFYKILPNDILVIHDELALDFGSIRVRNAGSDAGNRGIRSLLAHIGPEFWRIRIGINNELTRRIDSADFVLSQFSKHEKKDLQSTVFPNTTDLIDAFIDHRLESTSKHL